MLIVVVIDLDGVIWGGVVGDDGVEGIELNYDFPGNISVVTSFEEALHEARNDSNPFIIGGGEIYKSGIKFAEKIELTRVHENFDGDTFFPKIDSDTWTLINRVENNFDEKHPHNYTFETYIKKL